MGILKLDILKLGTLKLGIMKLGIMKLGIMKWYRTPIQICNVFQWSTLGHMLWDNLIYNEYVSVNEWYDNL